MSVEEDDASLKELVTKTLQTNGVLGKLQAQLRASVFLALEEEFKDKNIPLVNSSAKQMLATPEGALAAALVHNFLQCLSLDFSLAVFGPESGMSTLWNFPGEEALTSNLNLGTKQGNKTPLLLELLKERTSDKSSTLEPNRDRGFVSKGRSLNELGPLPQLSGPRTLQPISNISTGNSALLKNQQEPDLPGLSAKKEDKMMLSSRNEPPKISETKKDIGDFNLHKGQEKDIGISHTQGTGSALENLENDVEKAGTGPGTNIDRKEDKSQSLEEAPNQEAGDSLTGLEKQYEDDFSSMSEKDGQDGADEDDVEEEDEEIEEAEDIDEDISLDDLINSSASINSDHTKDQSLSQVSDVPNYQEDL